MRTRGVVIEDGFDRYTYCYTGQRWICIHEDYSEGYTSEILYGLNKQTIKNNLKAVDNKTVFKKENIRINLEDILQD